MTLESMTHHLVLAPASAIDLQLHTIYRHALSMYFLLKDMQKAGMVVDNALRTIHIL